MSAPSQGTSQGFPSALQSQNVQSSVQVLPCKPTEADLKELNIIWSPTVNEGTIVFDCDGKFQYFKNATFTLKDLDRNDFKLDVAKRQTRTCMPGPTPRLSSPLKKCDVETETSSKWTYVGQMKNGKSSGKGTFKKFANGDVYVGEWKESKMNGIGRFTWNVTGKFPNIYVGHFARDKMNGEGKWTMDGVTRNVNCDYKVNP
eukprot:1004479_1